MKKQAKINKEFFKEIHIYHKPMRRDSNGISILPQGKEIDYQIRLIQVFRIPKEVSY